MIYLIGIGMGSKNTLTREALDAIDKSTLLIGAERMLAGYTDKEKLVTYKIDEIYECVKNTKHENTAVLLSGDSGFYSAAKKLRKALEKFEVKIIAGISSVSYLASVLGISWEDAYITSSHGREVNLIGYVRENKKVFTLLSGDELGTLCEKLIKYNMTDVTICIGERLSYDDEKITVGSPCELRAYMADKLSSMFILNEGAEKKIASVPDEEFIRGKVPMTKSEVRTLSVMKLGLTDKSVVYDVGAGTGSVSVECALMSPDIVVYAIEKNPDAIVLTEKNKLKFKTDNVKIIYGEAPSALAELPKPDCVFIGGSAGNMSEIINAVWVKNDCAPIVVNAVSLNTLTEIMNIVDDDKSIKADIVQVGISKADFIGSYRMMKAQNPIYIITLRRTEHE